MKSNEEGQKKRAELLRKQIEQLKLGKKVKGDDKRNKDQESPKEYIEKLEQGMSDKNSKNRKAK
jgi:hypothetical protein